jgi:hypothetical protein
MFPETYGRTLEELAFLFEDRARADEATLRVEKQMEWSSERRWSRVDERMSWDMDIIMPNKFEVRANENNVRRGKGSQSPDESAAREIEPAPAGHRQAIRGERGGWSNN